MRAALFILLSLFVACADASGRDGGEPRCNGESMPAECGAECLSPPCYSSWRTRPECARECSSHTCCRCGAGGWSVVAVDCAVVADAGN